MLPHLRTPAFFCTIRLSEFGLRSLLFFGFATDGDCFKLIGDLHHGLPFGLRQDEEGIKTADRADTGEQQKAVRVQGFLGHKKETKTAQEFKHLNIADSDQ